MNDDATINENGGKFAGLDRYEARKQIVAELDPMYPDPVLNAHSRTLDKPLAHLLSLLW